MYTIGHSPNVVGPEKYRQAIREWWMSEWEQIARGEGWGTLDDRFRGTCDDSVLTREIRKGRMSERTED